MTGLIADTVARISTVLRRFFTVAPVASADGLLQRRDPRVAVASIAGLALAVMLTRSLAVTILFAGITVLLAWSSAVPVRQLLGRSAVVPLASALLVLPQAFLMSGDPIVHIFGIEMTDAGIAYVVRFTVRVGVGVALLSLLVMTTPFSEIVTALRRFGVPVSLVWVFAITYRYLFLFFDELLRLVLARNSRAAGTAVRAEQWRDARRIAGTFLQRALDRGERVGRAMRARGGARPPSPYDRTTAIDEGDVGFLALAVLAIAVSGVVRWLP